MATPHSRRIHEPFVFAALAFALTSGFGLAGILVAALAVGIPLGAWWIASVQAHGHAQLFGWTGLFIIGVGLFFLPRLRGTTLKRQELAVPALALFVIGIALRSFCQPLLGIVAENPSAQPAWNVLGRIGLVFSALLELGGTGLTAAMLITTFRQARPLVPDAPFTPVRLYVLTGLVSFGLATVLNAWLAIDTALRDSYAFPSTWDDVLTHLFIAGFVIPIAFALAIRNLPLFMRLAFPPKEKLGPIIASYVLGVILRLVGYTVERPFGSVFSSLGMIVEGTALLVFVWEFDVLLRRKTPWTATRTPPPPGYVETRKPTRKDYPDYGEYGRFELLIISAIIWLVVAAAIAILSGVFLLATHSILFNPDAERHAVTVGFITMLIFGMAVRMLPGFSGKRRVASTRLVSATFWLGNLAALFRIGPLLVPNSTISSVLLGSSGTIGWLAVACLAVNLWLTFREEHK